MWAVRDTSPFCPILWSEILSINVPEDQKKERGHKGVRKLQTPEGQIQTNTVRLKVTGPATHQASARPLTHRQADAWAHNSKPISRTLCTQHSCGCPVNGRSTSRLGKYQWVQQPAFTRLHRSPQLSYLTDTQFTTIDCNSWFTSASFIRQ